LLEVERWYCRWLSDTNQLSNISMRAGFFIYPKLGRIRIGNVYLFGAGLGNSLFPWARSLIAANAFKLPMLSPVWERVTSGGGWITALKALFQTEQSPRTYRSLFCRPLPLRKQLRELLILAYAVHADESLLPKWIASSSSATRPTVFIFDGIRDRFDSLWPHRSYIREEFTKLIRPEIFAAVPACKTPRFGCHIRLGDFAKASDSAPTADNARLPLAWYANHVTQLTCRWPNVPIEIFSDGADEELAPILQLPNVSRGNYGNAVADLVAMTRVRILICSSSSFSAWAAFLGRMPTIWYPGKIDSHIGAAADTTAIELGQSQSLPCSFLRAVSI
jgi:hypothetical protein